MIDDVRCLRHWAVLREDGGGHAPLKFFVETGAELVEISLAYKFPRAELCVKAEIDRKGSAGSGYLISSHAGSLLSLLFLYGL